MKTDNEKETLTFESAMSRLSQIAAIMGSEQNPPDLSASLELYAEAGKLTEFCAAQIDNAKLKLKIENI